MSQSYSSSTDKQRSQSATESMYDKAADAAQSVADQGRHVAARVAETSEDAYYATERTIRQYPLATVALSMALGFVVGALWKTGSHQRGWMDRMSSDYYEPAMKSWRNASWWR